MRVRRFLLTALVVTWTAAPGYAQWVASPYLGMNVLGDVEQRKGRPWRINQLFRRPGRVRIRFPTLSAFQPRLQRRRRRDVPRLRKHVGLRGDLRYFRALVDEDKREGVLFRDYGFWRTTVGVTVEFPR